MRKLSTRSIQLIAISAVAFGLAACGSSNNTPAAEALIAGTDLPETVATQPARVISFANTTVSSNTNESGEPLAVGDAVLATSETDEPDPSV